MTKKKTKNKAIYLSVMLIMLVIGITYAYWVLTVSQTNTNTLASSCVKIELTGEKNDISLEKAFPILDDEGMELTPYEFTLTNTCDITLSYSVNLEVLNTSTLDSKYIKVNTDDNAALFYKDLVDKTKVNPNAIVSRSILQGKLEPDVSKSHKVRIWMDGNITLQDKEETMNKYFESKVTVEALPNNYSPVNDGYTNLRDALLAAQYESTPEYAIEQINNKKKVDLNVIATEDEGLNKWEDEYGDSYFYRGSVHNNWVYFAGYYWRVIRINGNGTIRMIYNGKTATQTGASTQDGTIAFNSTNNDPTYVGYMYSTKELKTSKENTQSNDEPSPIKAKIEGWYDSNIKEKDFDDFVVDEPFCNDRTVTSGNGYSGTIYYGAYSRLISSNSAKNPLLTCPNKNDKFMMSETEGNGMSKAPVGLITADEVALAGGLNGSNNTSYYLYTGQHYWTVSPSYFNGSNARAWFVVNDGGLNGYYNVAIGYGVRPVINLKSDVEITGGSGTTKSPYRIKMN